MPSTVLSIGSTKRGKVKDKPAPALKEPLGQCGAMESMLDSESEAFGSNSGSVCELKQ